MTPFHFTQLDAKEDKAELNRMFSAIFAAVELRYNQIIAIITSHVRTTLLISALKEASRPAANLHHDYCADE